MAFRDRAISVPACVENASDHVKTPTIAVDTVLCQPGRQQPGMFSVLAVISESLWSS